MQDRFAIDGMVITKDRTIEELKNRGGYRVFRGVRTRVNSAPNKVVFEGSMFLASFLFADDKLRRIFLTPIMEGVEIPNYLDEEYQNKKRTYCTNILKQKYDEKCSIKRDGIEYCFSGGKIGCYVRNDGKGKFTGGNIVIQCSLGKSMKKQEKICHINERNEEE